MQETEKQTPNHADAPVYEAPAIIFETLISTRAGSPATGSDVPKPPDQEDSLNLFPAD